MAEEFNLAHLFASDRAHLEEVDDDRDAALSAFATLANESHDAVARRLDHLKELIASGQVGSTLRWRVA